MPEDGGFGLRFPKDYNLKGDKPVCDRCGCNLGKPNERDGKVFCNSCHSWWINRGSRPSGYAPPWVAPENREAFLLKMQERNRDNELLLKKIEDGKVN